MPRIPESKQQFQYQSPQVQGPRLRGFDVQTNAGMFGAESGRQLEKAGYLIQRGAAQAGHLYDDYNTTKARDAARQLQQDFLEWQTEAQKQQGEAGLSTGADYDAWSKQRSQDLSKDMDEVQRGRFESLVGSQMAAQRHWAESYGQQQEETFFRASWQAEKKTSTDDVIANLHNPELAALGKR